MFKNNEYIIATEIELDGKKAFSVVVPFDIKDEFKCAFKSAKWDNFNKYWTVGSRSGKRLAQWVEMAAPAFVKYKEQKNEEEALLEELSVSDAEKKALDLKLQKLTQQIESKDRLEARLEQNKVLISAVMDKIEALNKSEKAAELERQNALNENEVLLNKIVNVSEMKALVSDIIRILSTVRRNELISKYNKDQLNDKQNELRANFIDKLEELGLNSPYLNKCYSANGNRPDRDLAWIVKQDDDAIYALEEI